MSKNIRQVIEKHRPFYEVEPYYVLLEEGHGTPAVKTRRIQAGFNVNVYGMKTSDDPGLPGLSPSYALACASLLELTKTIQSHATDACSIEVIPARQPFWTLKVTCNPKPCCESGLPINAVLSNLPVRPSSIRLKRWKLSSAVWV